MEQIIKNKFIELNLQSLEKWEDEKELNLLKYKEAKGSIYLTIGIGKCMATYHDVKINIEDMTWQIVNESAKNSTLEEVR